MDTIPERNKGLCLINVVEFDLALLIDYFARNQLLGDTPLKQLTPAISAKLSSRSPQILLALIEAALISLKDKIPNP